MLPRIALCLVCALAAAPAMAGEAARPRLVVGGMDLSQPETRMELFSAGGFSAGSVSDTASADRGPERMAVGGFASYAFRDLQISSSLKGDSFSSKADFGASYDGDLWGIDGTAALNLGYQWGKPLAFSINPAQAGLSAFSGDPARPAGDLSLTLSFTHDVTPALSLGGFAAATRKEQEGQPAEPGLHFGAGLGLKF